MAASAVRRRVIGVLPAARRRTVRAGNLADVLEADHLPARHVVMLSDARVIGELGRGEEEILSARCGGLSFVCRELRSIRCEASFPSISAMRQRVSR
jgi:hypothetical protein